jgi:hypothetical protein
VATLGLCAAGWLALAPVAFGYRKAGPHNAALTDWATGAGLALVSLVTLVCWVVTWRRKLRADGILTRTSRWQARREARAQRRGRDGGGPASTPDPAQVLSELRALLVPLLAESANGPAGNEQAVDKQATAPAAPAAPAAHVAGSPEPRDEPGEFGEADGGPPGSDHRPEPDYYEPGHHAAAGEQDHDQARPGTPAPHGSAAGHGTPAPHGSPATASVAAVPLARSGGLAAIESIMAGPELLMVGGGEEEAW